MLRRLGSIIALLVIGLPAPVGAAAIAVAVNASTQATIGVTYSSGSSLACDARTCANTATLAGSIRSARINPGAASISLTGFAITGPGGASIPPAAFRLTCTGGTIGNPPFSGTPGRLANNAPLSSAAVACQTWTGTIVADYSLVVALSVDTSQLAPDTHAAVTFSAIATAN